MLGFSAIGQFALGEAQDLRPDVSAVLSVTDYSSDTAIFGINVYGGDTPTSGTVSARVSIREVFVSNTAPTSIREE